MFSIVRNTALAAVAVGLALTSPARATWLVDYNDPSRGAHVQFGTPTFLISDIASTFTLDVGGVAQFAYALSGSGGSCDVGILAPCDSTMLSSGTFADSILNSTGNPDVFTDLFGGTLTFTNLAAVPEPASLPLLVMGLAGLGLVVRRRRA